MVVKVSLPTQPAVTPRRSTILDVASVSTEFEWIDGVEPLWLSYNQMKFRDFVGFCVNVTPDFDQAAIWTPGFRFAVDGGLTCKAIGLDRAEMLSSATEAFEMGESIAIERALLQNRFVADVEEYQGDPLDRWDSATDITTADTAVSIKAGVALLEGWMADNYVGVPTIHMTVTMASLLLAVDGIEWDGTMLRTGLGSKVVAGAGYDYPNSGPEGDDPEAGEGWMYASGEVWIGKGEVLPKQSMENSTNEVFVQVQRGYIAAVDGPVAAIRVKVE